MNSSVKDGSGVFATHGPSEAAFADITTASGNTVSVIDNASNTAAAPALVTRLPMQFRSGGHVLGFTPEGYLVAGRDHLLKVNFVGAAAVAPVAASNTAVELPAANDLGATPLDEVHYRNLWPGIDVRYDGTDGIVRSTYTLAPEAKPEAIRLDYNVPITLTAAGSLTLGFASGTLSETAPIAWQEIQGQRTPVKVAFHQYDDGELGFTVGDYDPGLPLSIDPTLAWNTFLGGVGTDVGRAIAADIAGNVYVTGVSGGTWGTPVRAHAGGGGDAFVARLSAAGALTWNTFLGGAGPIDDGYGIATDATGNVYVTGQSDATWGTPVQAHAGGRDGFVARLNAATGSLTWNTFLGAADVDEGRSIATDTAGNVYVTGRSGATWGAPLRAHSGGFTSDAFVASLNAATGALFWNTFLGGVATDDGQGIAIDAAGNVYVTGLSDATWGTPLRAHSGGGLIDAFVARLSAAGALIWNTFLGGAGLDQGFAIATDTAGNVFVTGQSSASWGVPLRAHAGGGDAFVARLSAAGMLTWNTFLGGAGPSDVGQGIDIDAAGNVYVTGDSDATWGTPGQAHAGGRDAFVARLDAAGALDLNSFLGQTGDDFGTAIATDAAGNVHLAGSSNATWGAPLRPYAGGALDAFVVRIGDPASFAYITNQSSDNVSVIYTATNTVVATVPVGDLPFGVAVNPAGTRAYVANNNSNNVSVIDTASNTVIATVPVGSFPIGVAVNPTGTRAYVANGNSNNVSVIDTASNTVIATLTVGAGPIGIAVNPTGARVYVANANSNNVSVIDTASNTIVSTVTVGSFPRGVAINPAGTRAYVANGNSNNVSVIDTTTNTVVTTVTVGTNPQGVAVNPAGSRAYVTNSDSNNVSVIDTASNTVVGTVAVGILPTGVSVNAAGTRAYVANNVAGTVSVIDTANNNVVATVAVGTGPAAFGIFVGGSGPFPPGAPIIGSATPGNGAATIVFGAPSFDGGSPITGYAATCNPGAFSASGASSPLTVTGLANGTTYTCSVTATNAIGTSAASASVLVTPGASPPTGPLAYITNQDGNNVSVIDTATDDVVATVAVGSGPFGVGVNVAGTRAYVGNFTDDTISVIDTATHTVVATVAVGNGPNGVAVNPTGTRVYVGNFFGGDVSVIDTGSNTVVATVLVGTQPYGISVNAAGTRAYVANFGSSSVSVIDTASNTVVDTVAVGNFPRGVSINAAGSRAYVATSPGVAVIDTASNTVMATVAAGSDPFGVAVNPSGTRVYAANANSANVSVINTTSNSVIATVGVGTSPFGVSINPSGTRVYVANFQDDSVSVIDTATNNVVATVAVGSTPVAFGAFISGAAATAPDAPTIGIATPGNAQATINFTPPASDGGSPITSYTATCNAGGFNATGANSPLTVTGLSNGTTYSCSVTATNAAGTSGPSATVNVTPRAVPGAPNIGIATPGNGQATINFTPPASDGGSPITGYTATCNAGGFNASGASSPLTVTGLGNGTTYSCSVTATNVAGTSAPSANVNVTPRTVPGAPTIGNATPGNGQATINFTPPASDGGSPITSYTATCNLGAFSASGAASPITVTGLVNGTTYSCSVTASNAAGTSVPSASVNVTPRSVPGAPTGVIASPSNGQAVVFFTAPALDGGSPITSYTATCTPGPFSASGAGSPLTITGLTNDTTYACSVTATNAVGTSAPSASVNVTPAPFAYITNELANNVSVINTGTNSVVGLVDVGVDMRPFGVAVNPGGTRVYVANTTGNTVSVIDTASNTVIATPGVGLFPLGIAVNATGTRVYVTNGNSDNVSVIDTASNTVIALPIMVGDEPFGIALNPAGTRAYVTNARSNSVSVIDTTILPNAVIATVTVGMELGMGIQPRGIAVNPAGTRVYVANSASDNVSVIDTTSNTVIALLAVENFPQGIAVNPAGTRAYVTNAKSGRVSVIDTATNGVIATVTVGAYPQGITINPAGTRAYVANFSDDDVSVIELTNNTVIQLPIMVGTRPVAFGVAIGAPNAASNAVIFSNGFE